jgi:hypothetical protein
MIPVELIHAVAIGIDHNKHPEVFQYLNELLNKWTMLQT